MFGKIAVGRLDTGSVYPGPGPWWADLPESRLTVQPCILPGLEGPQAFVVGGMHIQCQQPGNIWVPP